MVDKYDLKTNSKLDCFDLLFAFKVLGKNYIGSGEITAFFQFHKDFAMGDRAFRQHIVRLRKLGAINERKMNHRKSLYSISKYGETILKEYFDIISDGIEGMLDTGSLPDFYLEEYKEYLKLSRRLRELEIYK